MSETGNAGSQGAARRGIVSAVLGNVAWQPPAWWRRLADQPRGVLLPLGLLAFVSFFGWNALRERPAPPDAIAVTAEAPAVTDYAETPAVVAPLRLRFSDSVAPLDAVSDEDSDGASAKPVRGVQLRPDLPGRWRWADDRTLVFQPADDWPVGQEYTVEIAPRQALASGKTLQSNTLMFNSAGLLVQLKEASFYQDPEDPLLKRALWTLSFSHPVERDSVARKLRLQAQDGGGAQLAAPAYELRSDEAGLTVWVQSAPLQVPENGGRIDLALDAGVRSRLPGPGEAGAAGGTVALPSLYSVALNDLQPAIVDNERHEPEQVLVLQFNDTLRDREVADGVKAWVLPERFVERPGHPYAPDNQWQQQVPYRWSADEIDEAVLAAGQRLPLQPIAAEREYVDTHSLRFSAPPGRRLWVEVPRGLKSFGGFLLGRPQYRLIEVPAYPQLLQFVGEGALLSLRGERRLTVVGRNVAEARIEIGRVLPSQLAQLVSGNDGSFGSPDFWRVDEDALVERMEHRLSLPTDDPARAEYRGVDLGDYFSPQRRGVFLLSLRTLSDYERDLTPQERLDRNAGTQTDRRLVVLTDLGVIVKRELDGRRQVFVQSLAAGTPVAGADVAVIGRNGETVARAITDEQGRAALANFDAYTRERSPVLVQVSRGEDLSFLPLGEWRRTLDTSRFDIGGEVAAVDPGTLSAVLFSDRGLYRPGETVNLGVVLRAQDWARTPVGAPLEMEITDPEGRVTARDTLRFGAEGFESYAFTPAENGPSGTWQATLYLKDANTRQRTPVGNTTVQVREFQPDTLRVQLSLTQPAAKGWVRPEQLSAQVRVENLFGTPAQQRRVTSELRLTPSLPSFAAWPGFVFSDPQQAREGVRQALADVQTGSDGVAEIALGLEQYERASYRLDLLVRAFEPGSGRGVAATTRALVSDQPFLIGVAGGDGLDFVARDSRQAARWVALGPDGEARAVPGLQAVRYERRTVSVLTRGDDGLYRYQSRERRDELAREAIAATAGVQSIVLPTSQPGDFEIEWQDSAGRVLNRVRWTVAGAANLSRSLERNAELQLSLSKPQYAVGEDIEVAIRAPYAGSGLITIERDRVISQQWFRSETTSSVQRIRLPEGVEGNAYVSVTLLRDPASADVTTSPLSWAIAPFSIDRRARQLELQLSAPAKSRPGQPLVMTVRSQTPARAVVFAVDEGILQVAGYRVGDPLDRFLAKRMHQVDTQQILDLLLPEFSRLAQQAAPGGDGEGNGARHLNPFKRRGERPAVWWSGMLNVEGEQTLRFTPPDHFNGELRLVAVAISPTQMAMRQQATTVRGDFVLTPTLPTHLAPGDVFTLPVGVSNTIEGATAPSAVSLRAQLPPGITLEGDAPSPITLAPGEEKVVNLSLRAGDALGAQAITLEATSGRYRAARRLEVSVRPLQISQTTVRLQRVGEETALGRLRSLYPERGERSLSASTSPLVAFSGLSTWLGDYRYACTEQLVSRALPTLVLRRQPWLGQVPAGDMAGLFSALRTRQNSEGGFGYWAATPEVDAFISAYVTLVLIEARERGEAVPADLLQRANRWLRGVGNDRSRNDLAGLRARALAVYLQVRQGESAGNALAALVEQLERDQPKAWRDDLAGLLVAASYQGLQQTAAATPLAARAARLAASGAPGAMREDFYSPVGAQAWRLYLLGKHFPARARELPPEAIARVLLPLADEGLTSLDAGLALLALESAGGEPRAGATLAQQAASGRVNFGQAGAGRVHGVADLAASRLWVTPSADEPVWLALSERGFDRQPPPAVQDRGLEVQRDYLDADGRPTRTVEQGKDLVVRLRVRGSGWNHLALVDLLPGGFEVVLTPPAAAEAPAGRDGDGDGEEGEGDGEDVPTDSPAVPVLALSGSTLLVVHDEVREDRVVLYANASNSLQEFRYRIRATAVGRFGIPPVFAEHMYRAQVFARGGPAGTLTVTAPSP